MRLILLGPPGSGKGVQAKVLAKQHNLKHISTGDLLRERAKTNEKIKEIMDSGDLVPDEITLEELKKELNNNFILDGFPRNLHQAEELKKLTEIEVVIFLEVPDQEIIRRIVSRSQCPKCGKIYGVDLPPKQENICDNCNTELIKRKDDSKEVIEERLNIYKEKTLPILNFYEKQNLLTKINGVGPVPEIQKVINNKLFKLKNQ